MSTGRAPSPFSPTWSSWWRPIDTAPKDGTRILVCGGAGQPDIAKYVSDESGFMDDRCNNFYNSETHWMPLPEPPEDIGEPQP